MKCIVKYSFSMLHADDICKQFGISLSILRTKPEIQTARFAQQICLEMALQKPRKVLPLIFEGFPLNLQLDAGVLAAAVGPIPVMISLKSNKPSKKRKIGEGEDCSEMKSQKRELLVLLGLRCPEDEVVMQKPVRATRDLFGDLTDQERTKAIQEARGQVHRLQSPMLAMKTATFKGGWEVDGRSWYEVLQEGVKATWEKGKKSKRFGHFGHVYMIYTVYILIYTYIYLYICLKIPKGRYRSDSCVTHMYGRLLTFSDLTIFCLLLGEGTFNTFTTLD